EGCEPRQPPRKCSCHCDPPASWMPENANWFPTHRRGLLPILVGILLLFLNESILVFFLFVCFLRRFQFQRGGPDHFERRAALIATDGVAFIHLFLVHIDIAFARRTCNHLNSS